MTSINRLVEQTQMMDIAEPASNNHQHQPQPAPQHSSQVQHHQHNHHRHRRGRRWMNSEADFEQYLKEAVDAISSKMSGRMKIASSADNSTGAMMAVDGAAASASSFTATEASASGAATGDASSSISNPTSMTATTSSANNRKVSSYYEPAKEKDPFDILSAPPDKHSAMDWSKELTEDQIAQYYDAFCFFDRDGSGTISTNEIAAVLISIGQATSEVEVREMLTFIDSNDSGSIDFPEFLKVMAQQRRKKEFLKEVRQAFRIFDKDGNGYITAVELRQVMTNMLGEKMTDDEVEALIFEADLDGDGQINFDEFVQFMFGYFEESKPH